MNNVYNLKLIICVIYIYNFKKLYFFLIQKFYIKKNIYGKKCEQRNCCVI